MIQAGATEASVGAIIGGILAGIIFIVVFVFLAVWCSVRTKQRKGIINYYLGLFGTIENIQKYEIVDTLMLVLILS